MDGEPLLCQRRQILGIDQETSSQQLRRKRKPTEKSRQEHWKAFEVSLRRKKDRIQEEKARRDERRDRKLQKLEHAYCEKRQVRLMQVNRILRIMEDEEREHKLQRNQLLGEASGASVTANLFIIFFLLTLSSPLWLLILGICKIFTHVRSARQR